MAKVKVLVKDINAKIPMVQGFFNKMLKPDFNGLSVEDLNLRIKGAKKVSLEGVFRDKDHEQSYDVSCKLIAFKGDISLDNNLTLSISGEGNFDASAYAYGIIEDEGVAEFWFSTLKIDDIELDHDTDADDTGVFLATVKK